MDVRDPVCGMEVDPEAAADQSQYQGETYYFCSPDCHVRFNAHPEHFAHRFSGTPPSTAPSAFAELRRDRSLHPPSKSYGATLDQRTPQSGAPTIHPPSPGFGATGHSITSSPT